jgi:putative transposase
VSTQTKRAYRYRFYPTPEQVRHLACTFGCCRFVYNWGLSTRKHAYFGEGKSLYYTDLAAMLPALKAAHPFLADVSSVPLQQALRHLERAYVNFFEGRAEYPTFKKKRNDQSATYEALAFTWDGHALTLAKMDAPLPIVWHRPLPKGAKPSSVTVSKDSAGRYFVSFLVRETIKPLPITPRMVGLDLGLISFVVTSEGKTSPTPSTTGGTRRSWRRRRDGMPARRKAPRTARRPADGWHACTLALPTADATTSSNSARASRLRTK